MPSQLRNILTLLRVRQYYKNILIFLGAFFAVTILSVRRFPFLILGFVLLCTVSSINYIVNDIIDIEKDKHHPEKFKKKPLASGELSKTFAFLLLGILIGIVVVAMILSLLIGIPNISFMIMLFIIIITGQLYNHVFKNYPFVDIIVLSLLYLWRTLAGCLIIEVYISPWLLLAIFELAMFLGIAKRKGDLLLLGEEKAIDHKKSYKGYSIQLLDQFQTIIATSVFITYSLYLIIRFNIFGRSEMFYVDFRDILLFLTLPILFYILMRYMYLTQEKPEIARNTEKVLRDKGMVIAAGIFAVILFYAFYFDTILEFGLEIINL